MKKIILSAFALGAFAFASLNSNQEVSLNDLKAEARADCRSASSTCLDPVTGDYVMYMEIYFC